MLLLAPGDNVAIGHKIAARASAAAGARGSVVGSAISPVIKVCANPDTYRRMSDDMAVDAGRLLEGRASLADVGREVYELVLAVAGGTRTKSETVGHREFVLTYKSFEPLGPTCHTEVSRVRLDFP